MTTTQTTLKGETMTKAEARAEWKTLNERIKNSQINAVDFVDNQVKPNGVRRALVAKRDRLYDEYQLWRRDESV